MVQVWLQTYLCIFVIAIYIYAGKGGSKQKKRNAPASAPRGKGKAKGKGKGKGKGKSRAPNTPRAKALAEIAKSQTYAGRKIPRSVLESLIENYIDPKYQ